MFCRSFEKEEECAICWAGLKGRRTMTLPCGHTYHVMCDRKLRSSACPSRGLCPLCRAPSQAEEGENLSEDYVSDIILSISDMLDIVVTDVDGLSEQVLALWGVDSPGEDEAVGEGDPGLEDCI